MKTFSPAFEAHIEAETTSLTVVWYIERKDGVAKGFTANVEDLTWTPPGGSPTLFKANTGTVASNLQTSSGKGIDNITAYGVINSPEISEEDLLKGLYDDAKVTVALVNYVDTTIYTVLAVGYIGEVSVGRGSFEVEIRSLLVRASQMIGKACSPLCRVKRLGDSECTVSLGAFTFTSQTVLSVVSRSRFRTSSAGVVGKPSFYFAYGEILWTSGANVGTPPIEIRSHDTSSPCLLSLAQAMPYDISPGDTFTIVAGCDRRLETCISKFSNVLNFRGEPFIPGTDAALRVISE